MVRNLLGSGALVGLAAGLVAQLVVPMPDGHSDIVWLVRSSLLFPAVVFGLWWFLSPELTLDGETEALASPTAPVVDADERLRRIEAAFDATAVPRARRRDLSGTSTDDRARFRASIGIHASTDGADPAAFGVPRPARATEPKPQAHGDA